MAVLASLWQPSAVLSSGYDRFDMQLPCRCTHAEVVQHQSLDWKYVITVTSFLSKHPKKSPFIETSYIPLCILDKCVSLNRPLCGVHAYSCKPPKKWRETVLPIHHQPFRSSHSGSPPFPRPSLYEWPPKEAARRTNHIRPLPSQETSITAPTFSPLASINQSLNEQIPPSTNRSLRR
jgi:hypothetical protein